MQAMLYAGVYSLVIPLLTRRYPDHSLTTGGFAGMAVGCTLCAISPTLPTLCLAIAPVVVSAAVVRTASTTLITHLVRPEEVGQMLGLADIVFSVSRMAAPTACGVLMQWLGSAAPLLVCAMAAGTAAVISATVTDHPVLDKEKKES
jgi:predicted MFS family arabinose efflux permease